MKTTTNNQANSRKKVPYLSPHYREFLRLYYRMERDGWFTDLEKTMSDNKDSFPPEVFRYAQTLIKLTLKETDLNLKIEYFFALDKFVDFMSGHLDENGPK